MKVSLTLTHSDVLEAIRQYLVNKLGPVNPGDIQVFVHSKQNYKATWEPCTMLLVNEAGVFDHNAIQTQNKEMLPQLMVKAEVEP